MPDDKQVKNTGKPHRWKKGQSGNPNGRPRKEVCLTSQLKELMESVPEIVDKEGNVNQLTGVELAAMAWFKGLIGGNAILFKEALDRLEGKVTQPISGPDDGPIEVSITDARRRLTEGISTIAAVREAERIAGGTD